MIICVPTETDKGLKAQVHTHFGSAPYFTIYDTEKESIEVISNPNLYHLKGTCQPMKILGAKKIDVVVCLGMGARAVKDLNQCGIKAYRAISGTVADIITQFKKGSLEEITVQSACVQHHCH